MISSTISLREGHRQLFQKSEFAVEYLNAAIEDGSETEILAALGNVADARGINIDDILPRARMKSGEADEKPGGEVHFQLMDFIKAIRSLGFTLRVEARC